MANGKAQAAAVDQEWEELKRQITDITKVFGFLLFIPVILLLGLGYGIRAGVIAGAEKTLEMLKSWGS
jgi:hypothetical protein